MRSATSALAVCAVLLGACGNYSTDDLAFLAAVPTKDELHVATPSPSSALRSRRSACALGDARLWTDTRATSAGINAMVDAGAALVDAVRQYPPTSRTPTTRVWGPFAMKDHPGDELRITMERSADAQDHPRFTFLFEARHGNAGAWLTILSGEFRGGSAQHGDGTLAVSFPDARALGWPTDPNIAELRVDYAFSSDPRTITFTESTPTGAVRYDYAGYASADGRFAFELSSASSANTFDLDVRYLATGAGKGGAAVKDGTGSVLGQVTECWDAGACITYLDDPGNWTQNAQCPAGGPCALGGAGACPSFAF